MSKELSQIVALAARMAQLEGEVAEAEQQYKFKAEELRQITENDLPEAMEALGLSEFTLSDGRRITVEESFHPSIPKAKQTYAYQWLREQGHGSLIKRELTFKFGKGEDSEAEQLKELIAESMGLTPGDKESVHHSTLKAFVKEMLESGQELPEDLFGVFRKTRAKAL